MNRLFLFYLFVVVLFPLTTAFPSVFEIPLDLSNKSLFYLNRAQPIQEGVSIATSDDLLRLSSGNHHTIVTFEQIQPGFHNITLVDDKKSRGKSGLFFNEKSYVEVPFDRSLENGLIVDFWTKPLSTLRGDIFLVQYLSQEGLQKEIRIYLEKGHIRISFQNMFSDSETIGNSKSLSLRSKTEILPTKWSHHRIIFTPNNGKLAYYNDGKIDSETWATSTSLPGSSTFFFNIPSKQRILLGTGYRGLIDQFVLSGEPEKPLADSHIGYPEADIYTRTLALPVQAVINTIDIDSITPMDTGFATYYRLSDAPFSDSTPEELVPWREYNDLNPEKNPRMVGKYVQLRVRLLADPTKNYSPLVKRILINYSAFDAPLKPLDPKAYSSNGNLTISLYRSVIESISAYKIYIGTQPDSFTGDPENGIQSPLIIPITNFTVNEATKRLSYQISGLTPMKLYYIKITALTTDGMESPFSDLIKCRVRSVS